MRQKILMVGSGSRLQRFEPLLRRVSVEAIRLPEAGPAVAVARELRVDLIVVASGPEDDTASEFVERVREDGSASRKAKILVLSERGGDGPAPPKGSAAFELVPLEPGSSEASEVLSRFLRQSPRAEARLMVRIEVPLETGAAHRILQVRNLSRGGLLVRSKDLYPLGTEVAFELTLPAGEAVRGRAKVVRHADPEADRLDGMGLCFSTLGGLDEKHLDAYLDGLLADENGLEAPAGAG